MVIDTSALVAIIRKEPDFERILRAITAAPQALLSSVAMLEASMVLTDELSDLDRLIRDGNISVIEFAASTALVAREAFLRYGKRRHRAALNFVDCAVYATARELNLPLLFRGDDFIHTDILSALA